MRHPFIGKRNIYFYLLIWLLIFGVYACVLFYFYDFSINEALTDSAVYNGVFLGLGLAYWFVVRYSSFDATQLINLIVSHLATAALSIALAVFLSQMALKKFFPEDEKYLLFLEGSVVWRAALGLLYYSIIMLVYYLIKYYDDLREKAASQSQLETMLKEAELDMLKSQINPHFIFNSLNSIASLTITAPDRARNMVIKLSDFLRYSLGKENTQLNTLEEELNNILLYLDIERERFGDRLKIEREISKDSLSCKLPNLILQPIVENAIKHGIYESLEQVTIKIKSSVTHQLLRVEVSNEFDPKAISKKGKGIGLKNVRQRLKLIYDLPQLVFVKKTDNLFIVSIDVPQITTNV